MMFLWVGIPFAIGRGDAYVRERITDLEVRSQTAEFAQHDAAEAAVRTERARIARELHDVVAHEITVMTLQAEGARRAVGDTDPRVAQALQTIGDSGRKGLAEMHRMIGVLRDTSEGNFPASEPSVGTAYAPSRVDFLAPMPSLAALPALVKQVDDAGMPVDLRVRGSAHVPAGVELSAYRIVQEALTNALKHAGPGAHVSVDIERARTAVTITVEDDGRGVISDATKERQRPRHRGDARAGRGPRRLDRARRAPRRRVQGPRGPAVPRRRGHHGKPRAQVLDCGDRLARRVHSEGAHVIRVLLVDDQAMVRAGLRMILDSEPDIEVVGEVDDGVGAAAAVSRLLPDVILMDIRMPGMDGLAATREVIAAHPDAKVVVLTTFDLDEYVYGALRAGASGFLLKSADGDTLVNAVKIVAAGEALLAPEVTRRVIEEFARATRDSGTTGVEHVATEEAIGDLSEREVEVLQLMAQGMSNQEIAKELYLSSTTVKTHVSHILTKLGVRDRVQAVVEAYDSGIVAPRG